MTTVFVTAPENSAEEIATTLIEEQLAACVNSVDCSSTYRWNGEIHTDTEAILFIKTTADAYEKLKTRVKELHPYDVPCIERFEEDDVLSAYRSWIKESVIADP